MVRVKSDGFMAYILLAFVTTAGLFYVNLGGAFLLDFVDRMGLSRADTGFITSVNKYRAAFGALITFATITLLLLFFIPDYPRKEESVSLKSVTGESFKSKLLIVPLMITMTAVFLFQASNMGVAYYAFELVKESDYTMRELSNLLVVAYILSVSGALLVIWMEAKFGRAKPIFFGVLIAALFTFLLHWSATIEIYFIANLVTGIMWAFCISYLLALGAAFDSHGQMAALSGFISKLGLASGSFIAALVIGNDNFASIINLATLSLVICALIALYPALLIDKAESYLKRRPANGSDDHSSTAA
jgi:DHA1 family inner membrane transport protein